MSLSSGILADIDTMLEGWDTAVYNGSTINGIYENGYIEALGVESSGPYFDCKTSDVSAIAQSATLTITSVLHAVAGVSHTVTNVQHAAEGLGPGMTRLILKLS